MTDYTTLPLEDCRALNRLASRSNNIHIYGSRGSHGCMDNQDVSPSPPKSQRPGCHVIYTTVNALNDDILFSIFNFYRLVDEKAWNVRLGWRRLSQVCQRWRYLVYELAFHLGIHILCTIGTPIVDTLDHLPPVPLFVDYRYATAPISGQDKLGIYHALVLRDRVRRIDLHLPPSILRESLMLMDEPFPKLEHLSLSFTVDKTTTLALPIALPKTFQAPNLRHLALFGISLPRRLQFLSSTASIGTLELMNIGASGYFRPRLLVARLRSLPHLEKLSIGFSIPIPRPSAEMELLGIQGTTVTLPNLKNLKFQGVSPYLEHLIAQIRVPLLDRLNITFFNQIAFSLPHLSHLTNIAEGLKLLPIAKVFFSEDVVSIMLGHSARRYDRCFILRVVCKQLDWQIHCAAQICSALIPALSGVEKLRLHFYRRMIPSEWQNGEIDGATWHELLRPFICVKELQICGGLSKELSRALEVDEIGLDPGLLPILQELVSESAGWASLFGSFVLSRQVAGLPVRLLFRPHSDL